MKSNLFKVTKKQENVQKLKEAQDAFNEGKKIINTSSSQDDIIRAIQYFTNAIQLIKTVSYTHNASKFFSSRGNAYMKIKKFQQAEKDFNNAIAQDGKNSSSYLNSLGKCKLQMAESLKETPGLTPAVIEARQHKLLKQALQNFDKAIMINSSDGNCYLNRAYVQNLLGKTPNAIQDYGKAISYLKQPQQQFKAHFLRGIAYRTINQLGNSIDDLVKACDQKRDDVQAQTNLGISYFQRGNYQDSLFTYDRAIALDDKNPQIYNYKAKALFLYGKCTEALNQFDKAIKIYEQKGQFQKLIQCRYNKGNTLITLNQIDLALQQLRTGLQVGLQFSKQTNIRSKLHYSIGICYEKQNDSIKSMQEFTRSLQLNSQNHVAIYHLGINQFRAGKLKDAQESFSKLLDKGLQEICVFEARGNTRFQMQNYNKALQDYQSANKIDQNHAEVLILRGLALNQLNRTDQALTFFFKSLSLGSKNPNIFNGIGQAYRMKKLYNKALFYFNFALQSKADSDQFLIQRSYVYLDTDQFQKAIDDLTRALKSKPSNSFIHYKRGLAYYRNNQFNKCIDDLYIAYHQGPHPSIQPDIHYHLGISLQNLQDYQRAIPPLTEAIKLSPCSHYYHQRAKCYLVTQRYQQALQDLNKVIRAQPKNAFAYFRRAFAYKALKKFSQSAEDFATARKLQPNNSKLIINKKHIYQIKHIKLCSAGQQLKQ